MTVSGMVKYPGTYEMLPGEALSDLLSYAGGVRPGAWKSRVEIDRVNTDGKIIQVRTSLSDESFDLRNGDSVSIPSVTENSETITIEGAVYGRPIAGTAPFTAPVKSVKLEIPYYPGIDLLTVLDKVGGPTPYALADKTEIRAKDSNVPVSVDLDNLWKTREGKYNVELQPGDHVLIPVESTVIGVFGAVNTSDYISPIVSYVNGNTVLDYIILAGGIDYTTADPNNITIVDRYGNRSKIGLDDEPTPGSFIYVEKNLLQATNDVIGNISTVVSWITLATTTYGVIETFIKTFFPEPDPNDAQ